MLFAAIALVIYMLFKYKKAIISRKEIFKLLLVGVLVALHWFLFYDCIKLATASVALICLSSVTLFTSVLEPIINKRKFYALDIIIGLVIISGIVVIFKFESQYLIGTIIGLGAALAASLFTIFNSKFAQRNSPVTISLIEMLGGFGALSIYLLLTAGFSVTALSLSFSDFGYLFILSTVCTAMAYVMGVAVMKTLSPITVVLTTSLEPVYGIILAYLFFGKKEQMSTGFYFGALIILIAVLSYPLLKKVIFKPAIFEKDMEVEKNILLNKP